MLDFLRISPTSLVSDFVTLRKAVYIRHHPDMRAEFWVRLIIFCTLMIAIPFVLGTYVFISVVAMCIWGGAAIIFSAGVLLYTYLNF